MIELLVYMIVAAVVIASVFKLMIAQSRSYGDQRQIADARETLRGASVLLTSELRQIAASDNDLYFAAPESLAIRSTQVTGFVCAMDAANRRYALWNLVGDLEATADDSALVFSVGGSDMSDDTWQSADITAAQKPSSVGLATCGWTVAQTPDTVARLAVAPAGVALGAPFRSFRAVQYGMYLDGTTWWLGRKVSGGSYEKLTGPLRTPTDGGLEFNYYDASGAVTAVPANVRMIEIIIRSQSAGKSRQAAGVTERVDSLRTKVFLRG